MRQDDIDHGQSFDWGNASEDYAKYRDIYPEEFYQQIAGLGLCGKGQRVLDLGTGTGVLPRNLCRFGASFVGADISENQIAAARRLSVGLDIHYIVAAAEVISFPDDSFDSILACQCFWYFDKPVLLPRLARMLKPHGRFGILTLAWLPGESDIARKSEELVLRYNPAWTGGGLTRSIPQEPDWLNGLFSVGDICCFDVPVRFTRESWNGRMRACRGIGASCSPEQVEAFSAEHLELLREIAPKEFEIPHYATMLILEVNK